MESIPVAPVSSETTPSTKKIWSIYFDNAEQKIAIYSGTQVSEILQAIRSIYDFSPTQELLFLDEDGIPVVLSASIPTQTKLYMQKKQSVTDKIVAQTPELQKPTWTWLQPSNNSHERKNNDLTVYQPINTTLAHCFGSIVFSTGKHYFTLLFEPLSCCVFGAIEDANKLSLESLDSEFVNEIKLMDLFEENKGSGIGSKPTYEIGFLVDMDQKMLTVTDHTNKKIMIKKTFVWAQVRPVVCFKHVVSITITNTSFAIPDWLK